MSNFILVAKQKVSSPLRSWNQRELEALHCTPKDLRDGYILEVAASSTGGSDGINHGDVIGALLLQGFHYEEAKHYNGGSWKNYWKVVSERPHDFTLQDEQFKIFRKWDGWNKWNALHYGEDKSSSSSQKSEGKSLLGKAAGAAFGFAVGAMSSSKKQAQQEVVYRKPTPQELAEMERQRQAQLAYQAEMAKRQAEELKRQEEMRKHLFELTKSGIQKLKEDKRQTEHIAIKVLFTIIPILLFWWEIKVLLFFYRAAFQSATGSTEVYKFPSYSFKVW